MMDEMHIKHTGVHVKIEGPVRQIPEYDPHSAEHLWVVLPMYRVDPKNLTDGETGYLDRENLLTIEGPGCYYCEKPYTKNLLMRRCTGNP
jgi:hypothetical protein